MTSGFQKALPGSKGPLRWLDEVVSSQWIHHLNDGQHFASLSPLCWSETPNSMCFKNGPHLQWWEKSQIYCVSNYVVPGVPQSTNEAFANMESYSRNMLSNRANHPPI